MPRLRGDRPVIATAIIAGSALLGLVIGLAFRVRVIALLAPLIALFAAVVLHAYRYDFIDGVMAVVGCLVASQAAYMGGAFWMAQSRSAGSAREQSGCRPGDESEQNIADQHKDNAHPPLGTPPSAS